MKQTVSFLLKAEEGMVNYAISWAIDDSRYFT